MLASAQVQGRDVAAADVDQPLLTAGQWIGGDDTAVVERSFADALGISIGQRLTLGGKPFRVVGIAVSAAIPPYPQACDDGCEPHSSRKQDQQTGSLWLTRAAATSLASPANPLYYRFNLKVADPDQAGAVAMSHQAQRGVGPFANPWQIVGWEDGKLVEQVRQDMMIGSWLLGLLAVASVAVLAGGRMADQIRRVGLLKAVGGTPGLVAAVLLAEYVVVALVAAGLGLLVGWSAAPLLTAPGSGLLGTAQAPSLTAPTVVTVVVAAVAVAVLATAVPALRAARTSTVRALADGVRPPKRRAGLIAISARLPVTLLIGMRLVARRPRRSLLAVASIAVTFSGLIAVLTSRAHMHAESTGLDNPRDGRLSQVLFALTIMMLALSAINAVFITWATVLDARHASALTRALGATPQQISAGISAGQVIPALLGALLGVPAGIGLIAVTRSGNGGMVYPPVWQAAVAVLGIIPLVAVLTMLPSRLTARRPIAEILQAETA